MQSLVLRSLKLPVVSRWQTAVLCPPSKLYLNSEQSSEGLHRGSFRDESGLHCRISTFSFARPLVPEVSLHDGASYTLDASGRNASDKLGARWSEANS